MSFIYTHIPLANHVTSSTSFYQIPNRYPQPSIYSDAPPAVLPAVLDTSSTKGIPTISSSITIPTTSQGLYYYLSWTTVSPPAEFPLPTSAIIVYYSTTNLRPFDYVPANHHNRSPIIVTDTHQSSFSIPSYCLTYYLYEYNIFNFDRPEWRARLQCIRLSMVIAFTIMAAACVLRLLDLAQSTFPLSWTTAIFVATM